MARLYVAECGMTMNNVTRRFPPPWSLEELDSCFVVIDSSRQKLAYVHFEDNPERRSATKLLSRDEALRIAAQLCEAAELSGRDVLGF
jgi:hypothetical protein